MTAEELAVTKALTDRIEREQWRLERLEEVIEKTHKELDGMPRNVAHESSVEKLAVAIADCREILNQFLKIRSDCRAELALRLKESLPNQSWYDVVFCRYGLCLNFDAIAAKVGYSRSAVFQIHRKALREIGISTWELRHTKINVGS